MLCMQRLSRDLQKKLDSAQFDFSRMNMEEESAMVLEKVRRLRQ